MKKGRVPKGKYFRNHHFFRVPMLVSWSVLDAPLRKQWAQTSRFPFFQKDLIKTLPSIPWSPTCSWPHNLEHVPNKHINLTMATEKSMLHYFKKWSARSLPTSRWQCQQMFVPVSYNMNQHQDVRPLKIFTKYKHANIEIMEILKDLSYQLWWAMPGNCTRDLEFANDASLSPWTWGLGNIPQTSTNMTGGTILDVFPVWN